MANQTNGNVNPRKMLRQKVEETLNASDGLNNEKKIGIVGALGTGDLGDEAMLVALQKELRFSNYKTELICFTTDPKVTYIHTGVKSYPLLDSVLRNNVFSMLFRNLGKIENYIFIILKKFKLIDETNNGEFIMRFFYLTFTYIWYYVAKSPLRFLVSRGIHHHINNIEKCDLIIYQGGAYINSWNIKSRIYMYLFPAFIASRKNIPVISSGLNIGPFNYVDKIFVKKYIKRFSFLGVRDRSNSYDAIREILPSKVNDVIFTNDDAITLKPVASSLSASVSCLNLQRERYVALNVHYWMLDPDRWLLAKTLFVKALKNLVNEHGMRVVAIPMIFSDHEEAFDIAAIREIIDEAQIPQEKVTIPNLPLSIDDTVALYSNASVTLGSRHHSMVLSVANATPTIAVVYDEYYYMKHKGVSDEYGELVELVNIENSSPSEYIPSLIENLLNKQVK